MTDTCSLRPPPPRPFEKLSAELADCELLEISVGLFEEFEVAGLHFESWPPAVRAAIKRELEAWSKRNPSRIVRLISFGASKHHAYLALHHAAKKSGG